MQHAGDFSDESEIYGQKRFEPKYPTSKEDLLALTALRLSECNLSGNQRRETNTLALIFRLHLHSESVFGQLSQLRAREHCLLPPVAPVYIFASFFSKHLFWQEKFQIHLGIAPSWLNFGSIRTNSRVRVVSVYTFASSFSKSFLLTGQIPRSLGNCINLSKLRLQYNQLKGKKVHLCLYFFLSPFFDRKNSRFNWELH